MRLLCEGCHTGKARVCVCGGGGGRTVVVERKVRPTDVLRHSQADPPRPLEQGTVLSDDGIRPLALDPFALAP
ncbi:MAG: hypothetical protein LBK99_17370 [Opitutaceae bacterium]|nr:hypothetical protein [Opitutaceae bacterium]